MNAERLREFLLSLPDVVETAQWGGVVFWVGDKAIGGKMFCMMNPDEGAGPPMSYLAGPERFFALQETEGIRPCPIFRPYSLGSGRSLGCVADARLADGANPGA